jgi:hypothetical protein
MPSPHAKPVAPFRAAPSQQHMGWDQRVAKEGHTSSLSWRHSPTTPERVGVGTRHQWAADGSVKGSVIDVGEAGGLGALGHSANQTSPLALPPVRAQTRPVPSLPVAWAGQRHCVMPGGPCQQPDKSHRSEQARRSRASLGGARDGPARAGGELGHTGPLMSKVRLIVRAQSRLRGS